MQTTTAELAGAYHNRLARFVSDERFGDWRMKLYGLAQPEKEVRAELLDSTRELAPVPPTAIGCVWELGVVEFERRAWIDDVIANPAGPDLDAYLSRRFDGLV